MKKYPLGSLIAAGALISCVAPPRQVSPQHVPGDTGAEPHPPGDALWRVEAAHLEPPSDDPRSIELDALRIGRERRVRDEFAVAVELDLLSFDGEPSGGAASDAAGLGLGGFLRWYALRGRAWSAFLECGLGLVATDEVFPQGGTRLNGTRQVGLGAALNVAGPLSLTLGIRQQHISNGRGLVDENPSWEGFGAYVGLQLDGPATARRASSRAFEATEPWPWSLRLEGRAGELGDAVVRGGVMAVDGRVDGPLFAQVRGSLDAAEGESLAEAGAALYLRGERGLVGVGYDRQELDVFVDDELTLFGEWYANDLLTVAGALGHEGRSYAPDRALGSVLFRLDPLDWLQVESGIVSRETYEDFGQESFDVPLGLRCALPSPAGTWLSVFAEQDLGDESRLVGLRLTLGGAPSGALSLRDLDRAAGPVRRRP